MRRKPTSFSIRIDDEPVLLTPTLPHFADNSLLRRTGKVHAALADLDEESARELLASLLDYFGLNEHVVPWPPKGLPGNPEPNAEEETRAMIGLGIAYLRALAQDKPRRRLNLWEETEDRIKKLKNVARTSF